MKTHILKIACNDEKGLIYKISNIIFKQGINIIKNDEFVGEDKFFFRASLQGDFNEREFLSSLKDELSKDSFIELCEKRKKNIVIFATKETHCLGDLLIRHYSNALEADIKAVVSNHDELEDLVRKFKINYHAIKCDELSKEEHEKKVLECLEQYELDYLVLAKYMRILTPNFVQAFEGKIINIHHSFLPAFIGANPYKQAYERGVKIIGATAHFVNNNLDEGPIITQDTISVSHEYSWQDMKAAGQNVEKNVLSKALDLVFDDRIFIYKNKTIVF
ncbi:formyltetrahydrofolate deformylase [Campylobacter sp. MIT 99-7217]|uniref:formyltetrahydrofolate deformylase n=1 Tax=Campylobacter sp. MIT 99-7217 TaxID=535091 RepID=UPI00115BB86F|nr:formyltetrahydrofolate deformylase [Campylobacter sp. MIT 99-7217]TQR32993.1 formyltetrahydrofolate deformylase [Campylobacter sp. MIT 99-7217]